MPQKLDTSEEFVNWVCQQSSLSLWSYASPRGKKGKELCDILVVCDPDIIIISVKDSKGYSRRTRLLSSIAITTSA